MYINTQLKPPLQYWTISKHLYLCNTDQHLYTSVHCRTISILYIRSQLCYSSLQLNLFFTYLHFWNILYIYIHLNEPFKKTFILLNPICTTLYSNELIFPHRFTLKPPFYSSMKKKSLSTSLHYWTPLYLLIIFKSLFVHFYTTSHFCTLV